MPNKATFRKTGGMQIAPAERVQQIGGDRLAPYKRNRKRRKRFSKGVSGEFVPVERVENVRDRLTPGKRR